MVIALLRWPAALRCSDAVPRYRLNYDFPWQQALSSQASIFNISLTVFGFLFPVRA